MRDMTSEPEAINADTRLRAGAARRASIVTLVVAALAGGMIWLLVFDLWLGQVERQYLWENARHELHLGPAVSLEAMMAEGRAMAARVATAWGAAVAAAVIVAARYSYVRGRIAGASWTR
jgi:hypothetical protein